MLQQYVKQALFNSVKRILWNGKLFQACRSLILSNMVGLSGEIPRASDNQQEASSQSCIISGSKFVDHLFAISQLLKYAGELHQKVSRQR